MPIDTNSELYRLYTDPSNDLGRKRASLDRLLMLEGAWLHLVTRKINQDYPGRELQVIRNQIYAHATTSLNIAANIIRPLSTAYTPAPRRYVRNTSIEVQAAFSDLVGTSSVDVLAPQWNYNANFVGVVAVVPQVTEEGTNLRVFYPHQLDVVLDPWDREPQAIIITLYRYDVYSGTGRLNGTELYVNESTVVGYIVATREEWRYYDASGAPYPDMALEQGAEPGEHVIPHDLGYVPVAMVRTRPPTIDYWALGQTESLYQAAIEAAMVNTRMSWVRAIQNRRVAVYGFTDSDQVTQVSTPDGEVIDPATSVQLAPSETFQTYDFETKPDAFITRIQHILDQQADQWGIPSSAVGLNSNLAVETAQVKLIAIRNGQIPFFVSAETKLWSIVWDMALRTDRYGDVLASDPDARERIEVEFPPQSLVDDPLRREELYKLKAARGGVNPIEQIHADNPHLTYEEARERYEENIRLLAETNEALARIGGRAAAQETQVTLAEGVQSQAQLTGRIGGMALETDNEVT